jgi:malate synthase
MNMPISNTNRHQIESLSTAKIMPFVNRKQQSLARLFEGDVNSYEMLDKHFALQEGSHKDVQQYVIYFHHIMAYFADGTHCGLAKGKQFVAYSGHQETPTSIVLKEYKAHIEILLTEHTAQIKIPKQEMFTSATNDDYFVE